MIEEKRSKILVAFTVASMFAGLAHARGLTLEERVQAQKAIEDVYWRHRTWPSDNPGPKPPLEAVISDAAIREKVDDYLRKSNALDVLWHRAITAEQLQAELNRMARDSRDRSTLGELFAALGNDPFLIAETLGRQVLANRLIRETYASDERIQGGLKRRLASVLTNGKLTTASVDWPKPAFATWWAARRVSVDPRVTTVAEPLEVPEVADGACEGDTWQPTSTDASAPSARERHTAVWTGSEMIVWGGIDGIGGGTLNSGGRYDPATDSWTPTPTGPSAPDPRCDHTAVWTGKEMIVWGGDRNCSGGPAGLNSGGRLNPATEQWTPTSMGPNVPEGRSGQTAVWTGTEMIVWGGREGVVKKNSGGRYDPAAESWTATRIDGATPLERDGHTAVWTGSEMIVWGGHVGGTIPPNFMGSRYIPSLNAWIIVTGEPTTLLNRADHSAVWTGTEMIVWGGSSPIASHLNSGGRYNPVTGQWTLTSTDAGVPAGRSGHRANWTGREMIIWGGDDRLGQLSSGGRYDPSTDTWTPTREDVSAPSARDRHSTVWTGAEMIVWGGHPSTDTGGRYCACPGGRLVYRDIDGDGFGDSAYPVPSCDGSVPPGYSAYDTDCNDSDPSIHPGGTEVCNGQDDDCDGIVDNGDATLCDDGNICTENHCGGTAGCFFTNASGACDDGDACTVDDSCRPPVGYSDVVQSFDDVTAPDLPPGWTTFLSGTGSPWVTRASSGESGSNSAFGPDNDQTADVALESPAIQITTDGARVTFRNRWSFDGGPECFDGGVLEIKIGDGSYLDLLAAGGKFISGGYTGSIAPYYENPLKGRAAWCNRSSGYPEYLDTALKLPATAAGQTIHLRWRIGSDSSVAAAGQDIDSIVVSEPTSTCVGGPARDCDDGNCCTVDACDHSTGCFHTQITAAPVFIAQPSLGDTVLWPPNHAYVDFTAAATGAAATSACGIASIQFGSCQSSQPENGTGTGDGNTTRDCVYEPVTVHLRAERDGACSPVGRTYEMTMLATDVCGNTATSAPFEVGVFHDRSHPPTEGTIVQATADENDSRSGTNGTYGSSCGVGSGIANGTVPDRSDADPEMEISQGASIDVNDLRIDKLQGVAAVLSWSEPAHLATVGVTRFHVYRLDPGTLSWTQIAELGKQTLTYEDPILGDGKDWQYKVSAVIK